MFTLFQGLNRPEFVNVCLSATKKQVSKEDYLFRQGESAEAVYLVKSGKLNKMEKTQQNITATGNAQVAIVSKSEGSKGYRLLGKAGIEGKEVLFKAEKAEALL